jgi:hypothetical protein
MGVSVDWYRGRNDVICYTFDGKWDWDELYAQREWVVQQMTASEVQVSVIVDLRETRHTPPNVLMHLRALARTVPPNHSGVSIFVTRGVIVLIYEKVMRQLSPNFLKNHRLHFVATLEEAEQVLKP